MATPALAAAPTDDEPEGATAIGNLPFWEKIDATVSKSLPCGEKRNWSVSLISDSKPFTRGPAGLWVTLNVPDRERTRTVKKLVELTRCDRCL